MADDRSAWARNRISGGDQRGPVLQGRDFDVSFQAVASAPVALTQLPPRPAGFTGRDHELAMMRKLLDPAGAQAPVLVWAVAGLAGVGKTALAIQAGHSARDTGWFGGGVLFIDLHGYDEKPVEPAQALDAMLRALGVAAEHIPADVEPRAALYRSALARIGEPVLVIADNASSEAQVRPLLPGSGPHRVVITSRHTMGGLDARLMDVAVLREAAAMTLLDEALRCARPADKRISGNPGAAVRLARVCGGLPLALQIVAALLKADPVRDVDDLADDLSAAHERLNRLCYDDGGGVGAPSVAAAFELSYLRLDEHLARVFRILPLNPGPDLSTAAVAVLAGLSQREARQALAGLARAHLVETAAGVSGRWRLHDLVRLYAARLAEEFIDAEEREEARGRLLGYYLAMAEDADRQVRRPAGMAGAGAFTGPDEAKAWLDAERANLAAAVSMAAAMGQEWDALRLCSMLAEFLHGCFDDLLSTFKKFLATARDLGDRRGEGIALGNLGLFLQEARRPDEAVNTLRSAVDIFRETGDRHGEGAALTNLGLALQGLRRYEDAIDAHRAAAAMFRETGNQRGEGMTLNNLGIALREAGRLADAVGAHRESAAMFRDMNDPHREGIARDNLGLALQALGRPEEAITAHRDAAALFNRAGDRDHENRALGHLRRLMPPAASS
jgi:tetratricopeptide (TPR) repeat protein